MSKNVYSILDVKTGIFANPFTAQNDAEATRLFNHASLDASLPFGMFPADFHLYLLGSFDPENGNLSERNPIAFVCAATQFNKPKET